MKVPLLLALSVVTHKTYKNKKKEKELLLIINVNITLKCK